MATDVSSKQQNFFHPVTDDVEVDTFFKSVISLKTALQVKPKGREDSGAGDLTLVEAYNCINTIVLANHISGPKLYQTEITVIADLKNEKYFCSGSVLEVKEDGYVINVDKLFRLQRRNNFRIVIHQNIVKANVRISSPQEGQPYTDFQLLDLSAGGFGMSISPGLAKPFKLGLDFLVTLNIGKHEPLQLPARLKHIRKETPHRREIYFHGGFEFINVSAGIKQQLAFLVNDCHRLIFSRL
jgi:hypothetical protein